MLVPEQAIRRFGDDAAGDALYAANPNQAATLNVS
jgi:hypothetical protein